MSRRTSSPTAAVASVEQRLARLLDSPSLARVVPHLTPETLHQLIRQRGLDACGVLVAAATPAQLTSVLDLDLWRPSQPGCDELFDVGRFGEWVEALIDNGPSVAARVVAALDHSLVIAGLSRYVRVFDPGIFEPTAQSDDEPPRVHDAMRDGDAIGVEDTAQGGAWLECAVSGYIVRARRHEAWDAIVALLVTLDAEHGDAFHAVMRGCRRLSNSRPEFDGLDDLLPLPEQHLHEVAIERERRLSAQGYAIAADARAFLQTARQPARSRRGPSVADAGTNPLVTASLRAAHQRPAWRSASPPSPERAQDLAAGSWPLGVADDAADGLGSMDAVMDLLANAGVLPERPRTLLAAAGEGSGAGRLATLQRLMAHVGDRDAARYCMRARELAFLANTLMAGCSLQARPFTAREASEAAASICNLGLQHWPERWPGAAEHDTAATAPRRVAVPDEFLVSHDLVTPFEVGWSVLHHEVGLFAGRQLISIVGGLSIDDADLQHGLDELRRSLATHCAAGTPWLARGAADVLATLDMAAWVGVLGLLDECPVVPDALTAVLDRRVTPVSPTAFDFISTTAHLADVRTFVRRLPDLLTH